jgi:hypothetical protein
MTEIKKGCHYDTLFLLTIKRLNNEEGLAYYPVINGSKPLTKSSMAFICTK